MSTCQLLNSLGGCLRRARFFIVQLLVLHVRLHRPPQCPDVPLTKTCCPPSFYQLQEKGVLCEDGLRKHLKEVPGNGNNLVDCTFTTLYSVIDPYWDSMQSKGKTALSSWRSFFTLSPTFCFLWTVVKTPGAGSYPGGCRAVPKSGDCVLPPLSHVVFPPVTPQKNRENITHMSKKSG